MTITLLLFAYALAVAGLAPRLLAGAWTRRSPRLTLMLWQAAGGSGLLAVALAGISCVAAPGRLAACLEALVGSDAAAGVLTVVAGLLLPVLLLARLAFVAAAMTRIQRAERRRHIQLLSLVGHHDSLLDATVVAAATASAYCVPGTDRVVLTDTALRMLEPSELRAVLAHERAHLAGRHHLVVSWAAVVARAFPGVPVFRGLHEATVDLVELLADDRAVRGESRNSLAWAIAQLGTGDGPAVSLAAGGGRVLARVERLLDPPRRLPVATRAGGAGAAVAVLAVPVLLAGLPAVVAAGLAACPLLFG
ncbi:M56 family metallopeptidase [Kribbella catacumbae]|uniref:M56 family metallopeptidase n=1 Tax=Kribbella catacumbae TaxID=460086 RepID=UPI0003804642|nr:M56 family metallopeptidase [Kribbella catacumbae]